MTALKEKNKDKEKQIVADKKTVSLASKILFAPVITEKSTDLAEQNKYLFKVSLRTTKSEIKKAVEREFNVHVMSVRVINISGKKVNYGRISGKHKDWKKAIITLKKGEKIDIYEGV